MLKANFCNRKGGFEIHIVHIHLAQLPPVVIFPCGCQYLSEAEKHQGITLNGAVALTARKGDVADIARFEKAVHPLALGVGNRVLMLENAVYAILSPEGFASILWKDAARHAEACDLMKLTATDLKALGVIDDIIPEPEGGAHLSPAITFRQVDRFLMRSLIELSRESGAALAAQRYQKFRKMGAAAPKEDL